MSTVSTTTYMTPSSSSPGQVASQTVDGRTTNYTYTLDGKIATVSGATYPVSYGYDHAGRLTSLRTFRAEGSFPAGGDVTSWEYQSGKLIRKTDAGGHSVSYTYDNKGQMTSRISARGGSTYGYDLVGSFSQTLTITPLSATIPLVALFMWAKRGPINILTVTKEVAT